MICVFPSYPVRCRGPYESANPSFPQKSHSLFDLLFLPAKHVEKGYQGDINPGLRSSRNARKDVFDHSFGHPYHTYSGSHIEAEDNKQEPELRGFVGHVNMNTLMRQQVWSQVIKIYFHWFIVSFICFFRFFFPNHAILMTNQ